MIAFISVIVAEMIPEVYIGLCPNNPAIYHVAYIVQRDAVMAWVFIFGAVYIWGSSCLFHQLVVPTTCYSTLRDATRQRKY